MPHHTLISHWIQIVLGRRYEPEQSSFLQWRKSLKRPDIWEPSSISTTKSWENKLSLLEQLWIWLTYQSLHYSWCFICFLSILAIWFLILYYIFPHFIWLHYFLSLIILMLHPSLLSQSIQSAIANHYRLDGLQTTLIYFLQSHDQVLVKDLFWLQCSHKIEASRNSLVGSITSQPKLAWDTVV